MIRAQCVIYIASNANLSNPYRR